MISTSPLRYPGGKTRFVYIISDVLEMLTPKPIVFVEPFCGGSGISLALLENNLVSRIALNDLDELVASFWQVVFGKGQATDADFEWLLATIEYATISLEEWRRQKALRPASLREAAWKCLFLNRTSFNGILHKSGPIGGWKQENRPLDVRFNREKLLRRLGELRARRAQVDRVGQENWWTFCQRYAGRNNAFLYLDPPYYHRAEQLYGHLFDAAMHQQLRDYLTRKRTPWLLSYDDAPEVRLLYGNRAHIEARVVDQTYSAHPMGGASFVGRELLFSNRTFPDAAPAGQQHVGVSIVGVMDAVRAGVGGPVRTRIVRPELIAC